MKKRTRDIVIGGYVVSTIVAVVLLVFLGMQAIKRNRAMQMRIATAQAAETLTQEHGLEKLWLETHTPTATPAPSPVAILTRTATPTTVPSPVSLPTSTPASKSTQITTLFEPEKSEPTRPPTTPLTPSAITGPASSLTTTLTLAKTPTGSPAPAPLPILTRTSTSIPPTTTPTPLVALSPTPLPTGQFILLSPTLEASSYGPTEFRWKWLGKLTPSQGFEVRVWREGETPTGVHNSQQDNFDGKIIALGNDTFHFTVDISNAPGVQGIDGVYLWTVALVQVSPAYKDLGVQGEPKLLRFVREKEETEEDNGGPPRGRY